MAKDMVCPENIPSRSLTYLHLLRPLFQIRSHSQVPGGHILRGRGWLAGTIQVSREGMRELNAHSGVCGCGDLGSMRPHP